MKSVKKLVIAECVRPRVWPAKAIEEITYNIVPDPAQDKQSDDDRTTAVEQAAGEADRRPAE